MSEPVDKGGRTIASPSGVVRGGEVFAGIAIWSIACVIIYDVFARALGRPTLWVLEISGYLMVAAAVIAAGNTLLRDEHFRVPNLVDKLPERTRLIVNILVDLVCLGLVIAMFVGSVQLLLQSIRFDFRSPTLLHVSLVYPQSILTFGLGLLVLAYATRLIRQIPPMLSS